MVPFRGRTVETEVFSGVESCQPLWTGQITAFVSLEEAAAFAGGASLNCSGTFTLELSASGLVRGA
jgi:hypothetical protein